jgi:hypothetical protein
MESFRTAVVLASATVKRSWLCGLPNLRPPPGSARPTGEIMSTEQNRSVLRDRLNSVLKLLAMNHPNEGGMFKAMCTDIAAAALACGYEHPPVEFLECRRGNIFLDEVCLWLPTGEWDRSVLPDDLLLRRDEYDAWRAHLIKTLELWSAFSEQIPADAEAGASKEALSDSANWVRAAWLTEHANIKPSTIRSAVARHGKKNPGAPPLVRTKAPEGGETLFFLPDIESHFGRVVKQKA